MYRVAKIDDVSFRNLPVVATSKISATDNDFGNLSLEINICTKAAIYNMIKCLFNNAEKH